MNTIQQIDDITALRQALPQARALPDELPAWFSQAMQYPRSEGFVTVDGADIHYLRWGSPDLPGVVLTHGFMAHARCWAFIAPLLADKYCVVAFDLSGMGDSGWRDAYDIDIRARECQAVARAAGLTTGGRKPALVCHSYGGSVGLAAAMTHTDTWRSLTIVDMTMLAPDEPSPFEQHMAQRAARGTKPHTIYATYEAIRARFRLAPDQPCHNDFLMDYMAFYSTRPVEGGFVWKFDPKILSMNDQRAPGWAHSVAPNFAALSLPRAVIHGEHSQMMSPQVLEFLRSTTTDPIPQVRIADAYHHVMLDQPLALASALDALLQSGC